MNVAKSDVTNPLQPLPLTPHTPDNKTWTLNSTVKVAPDDLLPAEYSLDVSTQDIYVDNLPANLGSKPSGTMCVNVLYRLILKKNQQMGHELLL
jgi:hypothetical protein